MKKSVSVLLCIFLLCSAVACSPNPPTEQEPENPCEMYNDIISQYTSLLTAKHNGDMPYAANTDGMDEQESAVYEALYKIADELKDAKSAENMGYGFKDVDGNGIYELFLLTKYTKINAIFTISDNRPILLEACYGEGNSFVFATKNRFFITRPKIIENTQEVTYYTARVDGNKMIYDAVYGEVYDKETNEILENFKVVDENRTSIDEDEFNELFRECKKSLNTGYEAVTKLASPRIYLPLADDSTSKALPKADFSSYSAIRETYKAISTSLKTFSSYKWISGEYDNLFSFADDLSFEYYTHLLYVDYRSEDYIGYDEIDLNGDGQDELLLLDEDYRIKAIFTYKNSRPVLLDAFPSETCWLDNQGYIHVDNESYDELEYNLYEFTKSGEYNLIYSLLAAENGRYLTKDGKTEKIIFEKSLEIYYDDYCRYLEPFGPNEQTRNSSELTYTPLSEAKEDLIENATEKTWHKYAKLEETKDNEFARSNTYVTFESASDTELEVNIKYEFTISYPDPVNENYLLDDTTESYLNFTARKTDDVLFFDENGLKGYLEIGNNCLWIIIEESSDERFPVGNHCYEENSSDFMIE